MSCAAKWPRPTKHDGVDDRRALRRTTPSINGYAMANQGLRVMTMYATPATMKMSVYSVEMIPST
jgi:hypothetical protein